MISSVVIDGNAQGEIVKRILYNHPEAEFVFCAGDDKVGAITGIGRL